MKYLYGLTMFTMCIFSFGGHKEFRFILPLLPIVFIQCGYALFEIKQKISERSYKYILSFLILTNILLGTYVSVYHQSSPTKIMKFLRNEATENGGNDDGRVLKSVHFLMPCHSTPYYSHLHQDIPMWFIDCSPPYMVKPETETQQIKYFDENPLAFVNDLYFNNKNDAKLVTKQYNKKDHDQYII